MTQAVLTAYHGKPEIRTDIIAQLEAHIAADELIKGQYWENGKGCAVACTIHSSNHMEYESRFGIPVMLARLEDCIFEGLPNGKAKAWPIRFMSAIEPGKDLSLVGWKFLHWILTDETVNPGIAHPLVKDAVAQAAQVICAISKGEPQNGAAAASAMTAASASVVAAVAADMAARAADMAAVAAAAVVAGTAWEAVVADMAARAADMAAVRAGVRAGAYIKMADRLIELIEDAPMVP